MILAEDTTNPTFYAYFRGFMALFLGFGLKHNQRHVAQRRPPSPRSRRSPLGKHQLHQPRLYLLGGIKTDKACRGEKALTTTGFVGFLS